MPTPRRGCPVRLTPGARVDSVDEIAADGLRVRVRAPAVDGRANRALIELLAERLRVPRTDVSIARGLSSRNKLVEVAGLSAEDVIERLGGPRGS